jgi:hypothetical protein
MKALRKAFAPRLFRLLATTLFAASLATAGTITGTVVNRTTGKPAANVPLTLLNVTANMAEVGSAKSDAQGAFTIDSPSIGGGPMLLRAYYQGVNFNTFVPPVNQPVTAEVFDVSHDPKIIAPTTHVVIFQPGDNKLIGAEEYMVQNSSNPPQAYFRTEGNFDFAIPEKGALQQIAATTSSGMPVTQASIEKGNGKYAIAYAFRPGETSIRLSYDLPYPGQAAILKLPATYPGVKLLVVAPPGVTVSGDGLQPAGQEEGMMVYTHEPLAEKASLTVNISGVGSPQQSAGNGAQQQQEGNSRSGNENIQAVPGRLDEYKWYLLAGMGLLFAMSAFLLSRKQIIVAPAPEPVAPVAPAANKPKSISAPPPALPAAQVRPPIAPVAPAINGVAAVNEQVNTSLDSLKDSIFRLELRHQAGTISEEEYASERARMEQLIRDLVRG